MKFGNMNVGVQNWMDTVVYINLIGEAGLIDAMNAAEYFWKLVKEYSDKYDASGRVFEWILAESDKFSEGYENETTIKNVRIVVQNGQNDVIGYYTRVGFMIH